MRFLVEDFVKYSLKRIIFLLFAFIFFFNSFGQKNDPFIVFLLPENVNISNEVQHEVKLIEENVIFNQKEFLLDNYDSIKNAIVNKKTLPENIKNHHLNQLEFSDNLNFSNSIIKNYAFSFQKDLNNKFPNALVKIYPYETVQNLRFLKNLSKVENVDYIIYSPLLSVSKQNDSILIKTVFKLYASNNEGIVYMSGINQLFNSYREDSVLVNNKKMNIYYNDYYVGKIKDKIIQYGDSASREMTKQRNIYLSNLCELGKFNDTIKGIIAFSECDINIIDYYSGLYNSSSGQILAFFAEDITNKADNSANGFKISIVYFEKKSDRWKYKIVDEESYKTDEISKEKQVNTVFSNLENVDFFEEKSLSEDEKFWKKKLFVKHSELFFD